MHLLHSNIMSHPLRVRGLKQDRGFYTLPDSAVAPPAGAWIETQRSYWQLHPLRVAPPAGAWIETCALMTSENRLPVAPPAGAWIETWRSWTKGTIWPRSHPLRVRGLKPQRCRGYYHPFRSHPLRVRGLKHSGLPSTARPGSVAPPAGAWIET